MAVTQTQLNSYLKDYERVFGVKSSNFFCPLTRTFKPLSELMEGHVFSEQFRCSKDTTVVQWKKIDAGFGSAYESHLLELLEHGAGYAGGASRERRTSRGRVGGHRTVRPQCSRVLGVADSSEAKAREEKAHLFWTEFENAYALIESRLSETEQPAPPSPWHLNTITNKSAIKLYREGIPFAFNFIYDVDGMTIQVTFPYSVPAVRFPMGPQLQCFQTTVRVSEVLQLLGHDPRSRSWASLAKSDPQTAEMYQTIQRKSPRDRVDAIEEYIRTRLRSDRQPRVVGALPAISVAFENAPTEFDKADGSDEMGFLVLPPGRRILLDSQVGSALRTISAPSSGLHSPNAISIASTLKPPACGSSTIPPSHTRHQFGR